MITKETLEKAPASGTGFLLFSNGTIVTNHHVIDHADKIHVKGINGDYSTLHEAEVVAQDKNNDLAIIMLKNRSVSFEKPPYAIRSQVAETGEQIYILGYPFVKQMGQEVKLTTGVISSKTGYQGDLSCYQVSAAVQPGNSGGPLLDQQGNLIGVVSAKLKGGEGVSYAIKTAYLKTLLDVTSDSQLITDQESQLKGLALSEQVKKISPFVYIIEINKQ